MLENLFYEYPFAIIEGWNIMNNRQMEMKFIRVKETAAVDTLPIHRDGDQSVFVYLLIMVYNEAERQFVTIL